MKFLWNAKDGGPESRVWAWGIESKRLGSLLLLKFEHGTREAFHTHAFNSVSWLLRGSLMEIILHGGVKLYYPSLIPIITKRTTFHQVFGRHRTNWVLTFRGPWKDEWQEYLPEPRVYVRLTHGRHIVGMRATARCKQPDPSFDL